MSEELRPCPFCGEPADDRYNRLAKCSNKSCLMNHWVDDEDFFIDDDWNTRPIEDALQSRIAELEKDLSNKEIEYTDLWDDALALQARIAELEGERRWIPVSERLPKENAPVLVLTVLGGMFVDFIYGKSVVTGNPDFYELDVEDVTHWMPLPTPPEVQE